MREEEINGLIRHISRKIRAKGDANLKKRGLTFSQMQLLFCLEHHGGKMSQKQLEEELNVSHPTVVGLVKRLEKNAYVSSVTDAQDKRMKIIAQSDKAADFCHETREDIRNVSKQMFRKLDEKEKEELFRMLSIIDDSLSEDREVINNV